VQGDGVGCHSGKAEMLAAAQQAGKSEVLEQYARGLPAGAEGWSA
jgi:chlorophyllide a reductase subunit Y